MGLKEIKTTIILLILLGLVSAFGQDKTDSDLENCLQLSLKAHQAGDYAEYHRLMSQIVEMEPRNLRFRYNMACACALTGDEKEAARHLEFLLDEDYDLVLFVENDADFKAIGNTKAFMRIVRRIREKTRPLNRSHFAFSIPEKDLIPEGIAYDPADETFYLGSLQKCKIVRIDRDHNVSDFTKPGQDGLVPVLGMKVDADRRILWAISSYGYYNADIPRELMGTSGVFKYDLETGKLLKKYMLPQKENRFLNDLALHSNGDVYVTDSKIPAVYLISTEQDRIVKFCDLSMYPNGIDFSPNETKLFIAGSGIGVLDLSTKEFTRLKHPQRMYPTGDGLYYYKNSLIAIQNAGFRKITQFFLNEARDEIVDSRPLEAYHPLFNMPTTGVLVGNQFYYIANSQIRAYDDKGNLYPLDQLEEHKILRVSLE